MATKQKLRRVIHEAGQAFQLCWATIVAIRTSQEPESLRRHLLEFQPTLAQAIHSLEETRLSVKNLKRKTVSRKKQLRAQSFRVRMQVLNRREESVNETIGIGKSLGDAFAWFFYMREPSLLKKHLEHQSTGHAPPGVGGQGELAFVKSVRLVGGHLVLYHGITTILRLGDVSFVDLRSFHVTGIGELKSWQPEPGMLSVTLHALGPTPKVKELFKDVLPSQEQPTRAVSHLPMSSAERDRLRRQLSAISKSFKPPAETPQLVIDSDNTIDRLSKLWEAMKEKSVAHQQCGDGLLLMGLRTPPDQSFAERILSNKKEPTEWDFGDLDKQVLKIMDSQQPQDDNWNSIIVSTLSSNFIRGTAPIAWWPIDLECIRQVLFQEIAIITTYNPAFFVNRLRQAGFSVKRTGVKWKFTVEKPFQNGVVTFYQIDYFQHLITHRFMAESTVVQMMQQCLEEMERNGIKPNSRVDLEINHHFHSQPSTA